MLRKLQCFLSVVDNGGFTRAAERLHLSQSAVSQQIASLERELHVMLLRRTDRGVETTESGRFLYENVRPLMADLEDVLTKASSAPVGAERLVVHSHGVFDDPLLAPLLRAFRENAPDVLVRVERVVSSQRSALAVTTGKADAMLGKKDEMPDGTALSYRELCLTYLTCVLPADHPLAAAETIGPDDLACQPLVLLEDRDDFSFTQAPRGTLRHQQAHNNLLAHCADRSLVSFAGDGASALTMAKADIGITLADSWKVPPCPDVACVPYRGTRFSSYGVFFKESQEGSPVGRLLKTAETLFPRRTVLMPFGRVVSFDEFLGLHPALDGAEAQDE